MQDIINDFSIFDIVFIFIILLLGIKGFLRGFIKEIFSLIGIVGGIFIASRAAFDIGNLLAPILLLENSSSIKAIGFIVTIIGFWILMYILGLIFSKISSFSGLGIFDRLFGFVFSASKIFFIISIILYALSNIYFLQNRLQKSLSSSILYPKLLDVGSYIIKIDFNGFIQKGSDTINNSIENSNISTQNIYKQINKSLIETKDKIEDFIDEDGNN
jgi:membrane protein required for colicin V production